MRLKILLPIGTIVVAISACLTMARNDSSEKVLEKNLVFRLPLEDKQLILTFDDGPGSKTPELLKFLKEKNIKATFFVTGTLAKSNLRILDQMQKDGHIIGNHTLTHALPMPTGQRLLKEIQDAHKIIKPFSNSDVYYFRPPGGAWDASDATTTAIPELKAYIGPIFWDIGGQLANGHAADWNCWTAGLTPAECSAGYVREAKARRKGIVLMHDNHDKSVVMFINHLHPALVKEGFSFVPLDGNKGIAERIKKFGGRPLGEDTVKIPGPAHPPLNPIQPKPEPECSESPDLAMFDNKDQKFSVTHGSISDEDKFQAVASNIADLPAKDPRFSQKWFIRHAPKDISNMNFAFRDDGKVLFGIRYNLVFAPEAKVDFEAKWSCDRWKGEFTYSNSQKEVLTILPI
jgi:peptidoglycan/xylan/chitin deacetylase (PgdA/CDA1 family)